MQLHTLTAITHSDGDGEASIVETCRPSICGWLCPSQQSLGFPTIFAQCPAVIMHKPMLSHVSRQLLIRFLPCSLLLNYISAGIHEQDLPYILENLLKKIYGVLVKKGGFTKGVNNSDAFRYKEIALIIYT